MRIAFFLTSPNGGGAERAMISVANHFAAKGLDVDMVFGRPDGPYRSDVDTRIRVFDLGVTRLRQMLRPLNDYMRAERPDVVLSALMPCDMAMLIGRWLYGWEGRLIISIQNHPFEVGRHGRRLLERLWPYFIRRFYTKADCVTGISTGVAKAAATLLGGAPESVPVIHNPAVAPGFAEKLEAEPGHPWFHDDGAPIILAAGRLTAQKDYPTLLNAFSRLLSRRPARLIVIGEGEDRGALELLIRDLGITGHVAMPGFVANPYCYMRRARLFVLSSRWEGFANVVAEALACGTPVVSTDCPSGPAEIVKDGEYGHLVPVGDAQALAHALSEALDAPVEHEKLSARGMEFSIDRIAPRYLELIEKVVAA